MFWNYVNTEIDSCKGLGVLATRNVQNNRQVCYCSIIILELKPQTNIAFGEPNLKILNPCRQIICMALQTDGLKLFLSQVEYLSCLVCFSWLSQYMSLIPRSVWCRDLDLLVMAWGGGSVLEMVLILFLTWSFDNTSPSSSLVTTRGEILARIFDIKPHVRAHHTGFIMIQV